MLLVNTTASGGVPFMSAPMVTTAGSFLQPSPFPPMPTGLPPSISIGPTMAGLPGAPLPSAIAGGPLTTPFPLTPIGFPRDLSVLHTGVKRPSDDLLVSQMVTNGSGVITDANEAKKPKLGDGGSDVPSRVIHIRSIPSDCSETEIVQLGLPFGRMNNILVLKQKNQAFLEMETEEVAAAMVNYYNECQATIRSRKVYLQFSNHKELKTDQTHANANAAGQAALVATQSLVGDAPGSAKPILRVIIDNMLYPVSIDVLHTIFTRYGSVLRIVTFTKNNTFQALIQFPDVQSAQGAKNGLDGMNIYNGCCTLRIDYSKLTTLSVRYNNDKSRDYTNPSLPSGDGSPNHNGPQQGFQMPPLVPIPGMIPSHLAPFTPMTHLGPDGMTFPFGPLVGDPSPISAQMLPPDPNLLGLTAFHGSFPMGMAGLQHQAALSGIQIPGVSMGSAVVLVSNLNEQLVTPDALFTLFGVYGDVIRVKVLFNKKDNALVQYSEPQMAQLAIQHLDKAVVWGKAIRVAPSKHTVVQMPREGQPDAGLTKDFTNSPLHRFKKPGSKNFQNIYPPSLVLHLSNIPSTVTEEDLTSKFRQYGEVVGFKFFPKDRKMALIQMSNVEESVVSLINMHDYSLGEGQNLRVSFSKSKL